MKVGILGSGEVAQALGLGLSDLGHEVMLGSRSPKSEKITSWLEKVGGKTSSGSFEEVAIFAEMVIIATLGIAVAEVITAAGVKNFNDKIVIDVTNPLDFSQGMPPRLAKSEGGSNGALIQNLLPTAKVVKTLNILANSSMVQPKFEAGEPDMFVCGNDAEAKKTVEQILRDFGWKRITDLGDITQSYLTEALCILWVTYGLKYNNWNIALSFLTK